MVRAAPTLVREEVRDEISRTLKDGVCNVVYVQDKLGGEISLSPTIRSPELSFDITLVELVEAADTPVVSRYAVLEVQTMDFHGTYKYVVKNLKDALRLHGTLFPGILQANLNWLSDHIEGPNIANVLKRTFYQMTLKFQIGGHGACAGTALAIPAAVWDSWQRHLGAPELIPGDGGIYKLRPPDRDVSETSAPAWIYVFDVDAESAETPNTITLTKVIATDADSVAHFALKVAPEAALAVGGSADRVLETIRKRLASWWPQLGPIRLARSGKH